ncbi:hypothetical protein IQ06DRAFT_145975 [Phaeosphaeriaceae sp. SRC1lsM3a]|nr:hypothetical protein IQ06DRAFT_145975 [Stagonospora sp. SRC1lsM3a]
MSAQTSSVVKRGRKRMTDGSEPRRGFIERTARRDGDARGYERQYACPFMARDPIRSDCRKGYSNISRVKEHLRRRHVAAVPAVLCPRCFAEFNSSAERWEHFRNVTPCELSSEPPAGHKDCISKETSDALNRRTKRRENPREAWENMYRTIFPDAAKKGIPSPYPRPTYLSNLSPDCSSSGTSNTNTPVPTCESSMCDSTECDSFWLSYATPPGDLSLEPPCVHFQSHGLFMDPDSSNMVKSFWGSPYDTGWSTEIGSPILDPVCMFSEPSEQYMGLGYA